MCPLEPASAPKGAIATTAAVIHMATMQGACRRSVYHRPVTVPSDEINIVPARETSLEDVNRLIARSKAYWDWPEEYLSG